jgi:hypothetical protein
MVLPSVSLNAAFDRYQYVATDYVNQLHGVYHHEGADQFSTDSDSDFVTAIVILGSAPLIATVVLLIAYFVLLLYRCCRKSCATKEAFCGPIFSRVLLGFLFLVSLVFAMGLWGARYDFNSAVDKLTFSMSNSGGTGLANIFSTIESTTSKLQSEAAGYVEMSNLITCPSGPNDAEWQGAKLELQKYALQFKVEADMLPDYYRDASTSLDGLNKKAEKMSKKHVNIGIGIVFAIVIFYSFLGISAVGQRSYKILDCTSCWGSLMLPVMAVVLGLELGLSILVSDYCAHDAVTCDSTLEFCPLGSYGQQFSGPDVSSLKVIHRSFEGGDGKTEKLLGYYVHCSGTHPLGDILDKADLARERMYSQADSLFKSAAMNCHNNPSLQSLQDGTKVNGDTFNAIREITGEVGCERIHNLYETVVYDAMCTHSVDGLYKLWVVQAFVNTFLILAHFFAVFVRPKFLLPDYADEEEDYADPMAFHDLAPALAAERTV